MKEFICICCPLGCHLSVDDSDKNDIKVTGNACIRGKNYAVEEVVSPKRMVTATVKVKGGKLSVLSVKTDKSIPKDKIFDALDRLKDVVVEAPVKIGDVILSDVYGADIVATKNIDKQ
jgi:CxxC motif-containing protein